ncbi:RNA polymerase sigma factor [Caproicibacter fermentans]|uniref:Sigma-70 family RNA polymerase sigma factor n=1 Tax=Caproicibacter fermentans TaxID=2576756 RepID=A0A7G8T9I0_9FIRM|nr:sigma-70 family RNA polymerase sigma factor [Caproicibacter fermentans]QNK40271.1 sigma-70 family RNA polymerase sigma factor [Caproicibacter fermentans]
MEVSIKISGQAVSVKVTVEVCKYLDQAEHKTENLAHEQRRHWDRREFDEYIVAREGRCYSETPEQWLCRKETLQEIMSVLESCTEIQRQRFLLFALHGLSYSAIGRLCNCSKSAVQDSIEAVRKKCRNFFAYPPYGKEFSG